MSAAGSKAEADVQIEQLRRERGCEQENQSAVVRSSLNSALEIISDELYQNPSHFLLELIQNADDNQFSPGVTPSLSLTLSSGPGFYHLRTDCNEVGFTFDDINAITQVRQSTKKKATDGQRGYIGEKGIGFKSVFKVADTVNIASGHYDFKFDRKRELGMILPIPSTFPTRQRLLGHTQFLLQLSSQDDYKKIQHDLHNMEPQLLIFLRNIQRLEVQTDHARKTYRVRSDTSVAALGEIVKISLDHQDERVSDEMRYTIVRHEARGMPADTRREGVVASEVVLAFPIEDAKPKISPQKAFAFLPIDDFGFKFLIHADFLLVASREGLDYGRPWNLALRNALQAAFLAAVKRFATAPADGPGRGLRYMWPKYIKHHRHAHNFWNHLHANIVSDLRTQRILESHNSATGHRKPFKLRYLPPKFRFGENPLFDCPSLMKAYLSFEYDHVHEELRLLGVERTSLADLGTDFVKWVLEVGRSGLGAKSSEWHCQVASIFHEQRDLRSHLVELPIIPLRDGSWVSAKQGHLYMASITDDEYVPKGINLSVVDKIASQDPARRRFYEWLGVQPYTCSQVCRLILELHSGNAASIQGRHRLDLLMDTTYLFLNSSHLDTDEAPEIYFLVNNQGTSSRRKSQIYLDDRNAKPALIGKYKDNPGSPFHVLDDFYENMIGADNSSLRVKFRAWLLRSKHISRVPVLIRGQQLTPEWQFLRSVSVLDLLLVVERVWEKATADRLFDLTNSELLREVPKLQIQCRDGKLRRLSETAIPTRELLQACPHLPFAALPNPERWTFLDTFGILVRPSTAARLQELDALSNLAIELVDKDVVHETYRGLNQYRDSEAAIIAQVPRDPALFPRR
ncbi:hypothetical protein AK830_g4631 [Neonectria ditissima]|uniref:Protein NO VEIN C-terminal domain-containing protein n=1 Tax=Neonectria ditissima TaxID=78410 RepID=A0A0P7AVG3_9HYPO|nr:hypothetical protein AK830_g4631 [Neonectria ditissima]